MARAEQDLSHNVPGLKFAFVYRDNWTRLNIRPAKIMQVPSYLTVFIIVVILNLFDNIVRDIVFEMHLPLFAKCSLSGLTNVRLHCY